MDLVEIVHTSEFSRGFKNFLNFLKNYFRVDIEGLEHVPKKGRGLICPNHSGYAGTDAVLLADLLWEKIRRRPRILAHRAFFDFSKRLKAVSESFGLHKASIENGIKIQNRNQLLILFPEGEKGNFKPSLMRYRLQEFHTGFLRIAIQAGSPIIPTIIIGAEESHLNLGNLELGKWIKGLRIPLPLMLIPLPAKWKIKFLPAIETKDMDPEILNDPARLKKLARKLRRELQHAVHEELRKREFVFSTETRKIADRLEKIIGRKIR